MPAQLDPLADPARPDTAASDALDLQAYLARPATSVSGLRDLEISSDTDESVEAIVKRVGILIVLSAVGFVALFKGGMGIMEPGSLPFEEIY